MFVKMKVSVEQDIEKKNVDFKLVFIIEWKFSVYEWKEKDNVSISDKLWNSIVVFVKWLFLKVVQFWGFLFGMLVIKKFFKRLLKKQCVVFMVLVFVKQYELIYCMEFKEYYNEKIVYFIVKEFIDEKLEGMIYSKKYLGNFMKIISNQIKEKVKVFYYDCYWIICNVMLGENCGVMVLVIS